MSNGRDLYKIQAAPSIGFESRIRAFPQSLAPQRVPAQTALFPEHDSWAVDSARLEPHAISIRPATAVAKIIGKAVRGGKPCYYLDDGVYHTFSGVIFDHCQYHLKSFKKGPTQICSVFGPTCDALDTISLAEELPDLDVGDLVYSENIGAYSAASSTHFNGFPPATVVHVNK